MDIIFSGGIFVFGSWAVPEGTHLASNEQGTIATCNAAGVFLSFVAGTTFYNAFLPIYHVLVVLRCGFGSLA